MHINCRLSLIFTFSLSHVPHPLPLRHCFQNYDLTTSSHLTILEFTRWLKCLLDTLARWGIATLNSDCNSVTHYWLLRLSVYVQWDRIWKLVVSYWLSDLCCWEAHWMVRWVAARQFGSSVNTLWLSFPTVPSPSDPAHSGATHLTTNCHTCSSHSAPRPGVSLSRKHHPSSLGFFFFFLPFLFLPHWQPAARGLFTQASAFQGKYATSVQFQQSTHLWAPQTPRSILKGKNQQAAAKNSEEISKMSWKGEGKMSHID